MTAAAVVETKDKVLLAADSLHTWWTTPFDFQS
jgi:hypothetical protein